MKCKSARDPLSCRKIVDMDIMIGSVDMHSLVQVGAGIKLKRLVIYDTNGPGF
jgi:hypothetical protein